ncbi:MAG: Fur family transcriptional regulator [Peptococcaceae bacterium BRH_c4b]|nr:MAG: Fur family transcriptional regulator [Peptococcaceae bacterium BRH_c4b]
MINKLRKMGLKVTPQRLAILQFLEGNTSHPTAEDIYRELKPQFPSLSLATVYNTLEALAGGGELQEVRITSNRRHFDPNPVPHCHFLCQNCDAIYDLEMWPEELRVPCEIDGNLILNSTLYLYGTCSRCRANQGNGGGDNDKENEPG